MSFIFGNLAQHLPKSVNTMLWFTLGTDCFDKLIRNGDFSGDKVGLQCMRMILSKFLGMSIVIGGGLVKVPQIIKIVMSRSVEGLSLLSFLLETVACCVSLAYNKRNGNPFSTYGETAFITIQNLIILFLMLSYKKQFLFAALLSVATLATNRFLYDENWVSKSDMATLQFATIPVTLFSKIPQIWTNFRQGHTGQLSAFSVVAYFLGTLARVFTTMQEVRDPLILLSFLLATIFNAILLLQMVVYWKRTSDVLRKQESTAPAPEEDKPKPTVWRRPKKD